MQINGELCNHLPWPTVSLENKCLSLIFHLSVYSQTQNFCQPLFLSSQGFLFFLNTFWILVCSDMLGKKKKIDLPWKPLENDSGWKEEEIDLFCTLLLFFLIVIRVLLKERLLIAEMFFQFCDQSHRRKKLRFPNKAHEQDRCNSQRPRYC